MTRSSSEQHTVNQTVRVLHTQSLRQNLICWVVGGKHRYILFVMTKRPCRNCPFSWHCKCWPEVLKYFPSPASPAVTPDQPTRSSLPSSSPTYQASSFLKPNLENFFLSWSGSEAQSLKIIGNSEEFWSSLRGTFLQIMMCGWCSGFRFCQHFCVETYLVCISGKAGYSKFFTTNDIWIRKPTEGMGSWEKKKHFFDKISN